MDVFSLLKFWRNAGIGHPNTSDFDTTDDEGSFFDLVFTNNDSPQVNIITSGFHTECDHYQHQYSKSTTHTYYSSPHTNNNISTKTTTTPRSPFRVLMLGFHNTKSKSKEMKCEIEEVTISSLLKRDHSFGDHDQMPSKRFSKDVVNRYLNLIKPLVSRRSNHHSSLYTYPKKEEKPSVFKEVRKHLGKSRSSSSSFVKPSPSPVAKRDDSAFQQQDGIQSAILHCKKSYNSPSQGCSVLSRSGSAPSQGSRISVEEEKRSSI